MSGDQQQSATIESETKSFEIKFTISEKPIEPPKRFEPMGVIYEAGANQVIVAGDSNGFDWMSFAGGLCLGIGLGSLFASIF